MAAKLPYLTSPGTLTNALTRIKAAATPSTVNADFVQAKLKIKGGAGRAIPPYLKKVGFVAGDGTPTKIYEHFRNSNKAISGAAAAEAVKHGYKPLYEINEYAHELSDKDLRGLIVQVTGLDEKNRVIELSFSTFKKLKAFADFEAVHEDEADEEKEKPKDKEKREDRKEREFNIAYTINLNLPPTTNVEVFNAIFKSLKENLLSED